jgi:acyl carrier protein
VQSAYAETKRAEFNDVSLRVAVCVCPPPAAALAIMHNTLQQQVRAVVLEHGRLTDASGLTDDSDLYTLGLTSHASVAVMLALEAAFDLEFPDRFLTRQVFESVQNIARAISELRGESSATGAR